MRSARRPQEIPVFKVPDDAPVKTCKMCGVSIRWGITNTGRNIPVGLDGRPHFKDCKRNCAQRG